MFKDGPFIELADKNRGTSWDTKIPQAAIDVKRIQIMLECIRHVLRPDGMNI